MSDLRNGNPADQSVQARLAAIWAEVLCLERVNPTDDFFELGGYSLIAGKIVGRVQEALGVELAVSAVLANPTVAGLAREIESRQSDPTRAVTIPRADAAGRAPLSLIQEEVWFHSKIAPGNVAYNTQWSLRVLGLFDIDLFERAIDELMARHDMLRTVFGEDAEGEAWQEVRPSVPARVIRHDLTHLPEAQRAGQLEEIVSAETARPFDLAVLPLFRWVSIKLAPGEHDLLLTEHHFVHDGWSFTVHTRELAELYAALHDRRQPELPVPHLQYADFARWQRAATDSGELAGHRAYWHGRLAGAPRVLALPSDRARPHRQDFRGGEIRLDLSGEVPDRLRELCRYKGATLFMGMLAGFAIWLHRYTGERDLCIGSGFANRRRETEDLIGMFVNTVVLRCGVGPRSSFSDVLEGVRDVVLGATEHQAYPFIRLVAELRPERDLAYNPLFQVMFSFHDTPAGQLRFGDAPVSILERSNGSAKADLNVVVIPRAERQLGTREVRDDRITVLWEYNSGLFDPATAEAMAGQYQRLLAAATADPSAPVWRLPMVSGTEHELLDRFARGAA